VLPLPPLQASTRTTRSSLFPSIGHLYPEGVARLSAAEDEDAVGKALQDAYPEYALLWNSAPMDAVRYKPPRCRACMGAAWSQQPDRSSLS